MMNSSFSLRNFHQEFSTNIFVKQRTNNLFTKISQVFMESIELLLPYAIEIAEAFDIDLRKDRELIALKKFTKAIPESMKIEFQEYCELQNHMELLKTTNAEYKKIKSNNADTRNRLIVNIKGVNGTKVKKEKMSREIHLGTKSREERVKAREKRIAERRAIWAKDAVGEHMRVQKEEEEAIQKERLKKLSKIHELPSNNLIWDVILPGLSSENASTHNIVFGIEENHNKISHKEIVNLGKDLVEALLENDIGCGEDFLNNLLARIHHRHDSDKGDLLSEHYIDILRSCFIIFGIFPKNWKPKTKEDLDAMEKYSNRRLDYFSWETRLN